eukprot:gene7882-16138_t
MYHANHPVVLERALSKQYGIEKRILSAKLLKYKRPARLGDKLECQLSTFTAEGWYSAKILSEDGQEILTCKKLTIVDVNRRDNVVVGPEIVSEGNMCSSRFRLWSDELSPGYCLTTKSIFNLFERGRTDSLGGPAALAKLSKETVLVNVVRVNDYKFISDLPASTTSSHANSNTAIEVSVLTQPLSVGSTMIDFHQQVVVQVDGRDFVLARANIVCAAVDATTGGMAAMPEHILRLVGL